MAKPMYYWNGTAWEAVGPEVPQSPIAYQASAPSTPSTGDLWIDSDQDLDTYQRQLVRYKFIASGGETSLSGADANGATLSYTPGAEQVYLNGALLVRGSDYVATDGTSITSLAALSVNDVVEIFAYVAFNVANTYTQSQVDGLVAPMGLVHIGTTNTSGAVSSVSIDDVFSADYVQYKIIFDLDYSTTHTGLSFRLRASGTDNTGSNYVRQLITANSTSLNSSRITSTSWAATVRDIGGFNLEIFNPFATKQTLLEVNTASTSSTIGDFGLQNQPEFMLHKNAISYDGFTVFPQAGTIDGKISVLGYKI